MSMRGFDSAQAAYDNATPPDAPDLTDDPGTACKGHYLADATTDAWECDRRSVCYLCDGTVCREHDEVEKCSGEVVHAACHDHGCLSYECAQDRRDDYLIAQDDANRGR